MASARSGAKSDKSEVPDSLPESAHQLDNGVILDKNDPYYEQRLEIENLRMEVRSAEAQTVEQASTNQDELVKAQLDAEKARLRAMLAEAREAGRSGERGSSVAVEQVRAQEEQANQLAEAVGDGEKGN